MSKKGAEGQWIWFLAVIAVLFLIINSVIFYPGFMSYDTLQQLSQAMGIEGYSNWHPPIMAFLWSIGIGVTGMVASFLLFQMAMLWGALFICSLIVYARTRSRLYSLFPLLFGFSPFILSISGVIWKDVHMAFALLLASCLAIAAPYAGHRTKIVFAILGSICVLYALMLRYNAIFAVLPILYLFISSFIRQFKVVIVVMTGFVLAAFGGGIVLGNVLHVRESNPTAAIMLDDIIHAVPASQIESANIRQDAKKDLVEIKAKCDRENVLLHALLYCTSSARQVARIQYDYFGDIQRLWADVFIHDLPGYVGYRLQTYAVFLASPGRYEYVMHQGIDANDLGQQVSHPGALKALDVYIEKFAAHDFGFMFRPYFWLSIAVSLLIYVMRSKMIEYRLAIIALTASAIIYILGYIPLVIGADYRYIYWSVLATCLAALLVILGQKGRKNRG